MLLAAAASPSAASEVPEKVGISNETKRLLCRTQLLCFAVKSTNFTVFYMISGEGCGGRTEPPSEGAIRERV